MAAAVFLAVVPAAAQGGTDAHRITCGYLDDGNGAGSAASLLPGETPASGESILQENAGAWRTCYFGSSLAIALFADPTWCYAAPTKDVVLKGCNGFKNQQWTIVGGNEYKNASTGTYLCATDGVGSKDTTAPLSQCSAYHSQWQSESTANAP
jgi:hypothetical protein